MTKFEFNLDGYCSQFDVYYSYYYARLNVVSVRRVYDGTYCYTYRQFVYKVNVLGLTCYKIGESLDSVILKDEAQS